MCHAHAPCVAAGSFKTKSHLYIILEYMEKGSLANIIRPSKFGALPESLAAVYIAQVLQGLAYLHEQGVVHRDIKGANILTGNEVRTPSPQGAGHAGFGGTHCLLQCQVNAYAQRGWAQITLWKRHWVPGLFPRCVKCLCTRQGVVKLADFGVAAKLSEGEEGDDSLAAAVVGTPYWMAPEVLPVSPSTAAPSSAPMIMGLL